MNTTKDEDLRYLFSKVGEIYTAIPTEPLDIQQYEQVLAEIESICLQVLVGVHFTSKQNREYALQAIRINNE